MVVAGSAVMETGAIADGSWAKVLVVVFVALILATMEEAIGSIAEACGVTLFTGGGSVLELLGVMRCRFLGGSSARTGSHFPVNRSWSHFLCVLSAFEHRAALQRDLTLDF
jgi:hypothetical protein